MFTPDTEITLSYGNQRAVLSPWGAALRRYCLLTSRNDHWDVVWGYSGGSNKKGGQGDVLIPFPGRIAGGRYEFEGQSYQLDRNDKEGPNAIHGFLRTVPWTIHEQTANRASFEVRLDEVEYGSRGYPFSLEVSVSYHLDATGLVCAFAVRNVGRKTAPIGVGFHPYFTVRTPSIDGAEIKIPASGHLEFNEQLTPTGTVLDAAGTEWDYRDYRAIGDRRFNHCYVHLERESDGGCTASLRNPLNGLTINLVMDQAFRALVVYTGDAIDGAARRAVAIEPMTCASDAFNHPEWGLTRLAPSAQFTGCYLVQPQGWPL